jgi:hypothetical protein
MVIYLKNFEVESLAVVLTNITQRSGIKDKQIVGVNGLTAYKLNKLIKDISAEAKDWQETKQALMNKHVEGGAEEPKTKGNEYVFKSEEDEKQFREVAEAYSEVNVRTLLAEKDLEQLQITGMEMQFLEKVIQGDARTEKPEEMGVDNSLPESTKEVAEKETPKNSKPEPVTKE